MRNSVAQRDLAEDISNSFQAVVPKLVLQTERVAKRIGMLAVDVQTLHLMVLHDGPLTPTAIGALSELPPSSTTRVLDRLEQRDYLRRIPDDKDQRSFRIELNSERVASVRLLFDDFATDFRALSASFNARDQAAIVRFMQGLVALL